MNEVYLTSKIYSDNRKELSNTRSPYKRYLRPNHGVYARLRSSQTYALPLESNVGSHAYRPFCDCLDLSVTRSYQRKKKRQPVRSSLIKQSSAVPGGVLTHSPLLLCRSV